MPWYVILALVSIVIAPFDALYMYIKASRRKEKMKERQEESDKTHFTDA